MLLSYMCNGMEDMVLIETKTLGNKVVLLHFKIATSGIFSMLPNGMSNSTADYFQTEIPLANASVIKDKLSLLSQFQNIT